MDRAQHGDERVTLAARFEPLSDRAGLIVIEADSLPQAAMSQHVLADSALPSPVSVVDLRLQGGRIRRIIAARLPDAAGKTPVLAVRNLADAEAAPVEAKLRSAAFAPAGLLADLPPGGALRLARLLFEFCAASLRLQGDPPFLAAAQAFLKVLQPAPTPATRIAVTRRHGMIAAQLPARIGAPRAVFLVGTNGVARTPTAPIVAPAAGSGDGGPVALQVLFDRAAQPGPLTALALGEQGLAVLAVPGGQGAPHLLRWLEGKPAEVSEFCRHLMHGIAPLIAAEPDGKAALQEIQVSLPRDPVMRVTPGQPAGGVLDLAIGTDAGLFLSGWIHDPHDMLAAIQVISPFGTTNAMRAPMFRYPREDVAAIHPGLAEPGATAPWGFAMFLPGFVEPAPALQYRLDLVLRSGASFDLVSRMSVAGPAGLRDAILQAVPPRHMTREMMTACIAPPVAALHRAAIATRPAPEAMAFGAPPGQAAPATIVVPVYRNLDYLRAQHAALALDPETRACDLVYVLDSPEQRGALVQMLRGFHTSYGMPFRLLVMPGNCGYAAACNAGARQGSAALLLLLNSDVVPAGRGWFGRLRAGLEADPMAAAAGAKLLYDDDSLQHAGLYFARDENGVWQSHHFHKGFPRDYPEACVARRVPAVTGAAMLLRRAVFDAAGGLSEDYIIGDYEDSDLCLRLRTAGHAIRYEPTAELYHFERRSMPMNASYWTTNVSEYNRLLHETRWAEMMAQEVAPEAERPRSGRARRKAT